MAHGTNPDSASCQFYITLSPLPDQDMKNTIFGGVESGMDVVQRIAKGDKINSISLQENSNEQVYVPPVITVHPEACYEPTLPDPKYLDAEQERLASKQHLNWSGLIYLADSNDPAKPELRAVSYGLKPWTAKEKKDIEGVIDRIWHIVPGLLIRAACGSQLAMCRASFVRGDGSMPISGAACPRAIVLTDRFFSKTYQFTSLVHELVHECDLNGRIANSKEWIRFINPKITKLRMQIAFSPTNQQKLTADAIRSNVVPTYHSCANLDEALADITAAYVANSEFHAPPTFFTKFGRRILLPDDRDARNDLQFKMGYIQFRNGNAGEAIETLLPIVQTEPNLGMPRAVLAASYDKASDYLHGSQQSERAMKCFSAAGAPWTQPNVEFARGWLLSCYHQSSRFDKQTALSNGTLLHVPFDSLALYYRFKMEDRQKNYAAAARDLYWYRFGAAYASELKDANSDPYFAVQLIDQEVEKFQKWHDMPNVNPLRRAHLLEWLGDKTKDPQKQTDLYRRALADYRTTLDWKISKTEVLLDCYNINLKLDDVAEAEKYESLALKDYPKEITTQVMHIQILSAKGKDSEVADAYKHFRETKGTPATNLVRAH